MDLAEQKCQACEGGVPPLSKEEIVPYFKQIEGTGWKVNNDTRLAKSYEFKDFKESMAFVEKVAVIAESEGHHPDIWISYNKVGIELTTYAIKGLSVNDFILAAKINRVV